ncbi:MAG: thioredoxin domain-containing protein [Simkaniaceae bacterium]|nr:thioredoxin domain-containing protein [Simkaniaceae bacterium]
MNHLEGQTSPFLRRYLKSPIDWFPWSEEAFVKARQEDKPILLSIGYSTCHWCHKMEKETFFDSEIADLLNASFVAILVDREELAHVDRIYTDFAKSLLGYDIGWPLNIILSFDLKPFFATTYLPRDPTSDAMGMRQLLLEVDQVWKSQDRSLLTEQSKEMIEIHQEKISSEGSQLPPATTIERTIEAMLMRADVKCGGFESLPKFPMGNMLSFAAKAASNYNEPRMHYFVQKTLDGISQGGICDRIGGGFFRYSIDLEWHIPNFEKNLSDNALLAKAFAEGYQLTGSSAYKDQGIAICQFAESLLNGGFYTSVDAKPDYYTWSLGELESIVGPEEGPLVSEFYQATDEGNFSGRNILFCDERVEEFCGRKQLDAKAFDKVLHRAEKLLHKERKKRKRPFVDAKILLGPNALMVDALATCGFAFRKTPLLEKARACADFLIEHHLSDGWAKRSYCEGKLSGEATLDDYAYFVRALLTLFELGQGSYYLGLAAELTTKIRDLFKREDGGYFYTSERESYLLRRCDFEDFSEPSGNGVHCDNLLRLFQMTDNPLYLLDAEDILKAGYQTLLDKPISCFSMIQALMRYFDVKAPTLMISLDRDASLKNEIEKRLGKGYYPHLVTVWNQHEDAIIQRLIPQIKQRQCKDGQTTLYHCMKQECLESFSDEAGILKFLKNL